MKSTADEDGQQGRHILGERDRKVRKASVCAFRSTLCRFLNTRQKCGKQTLRCSARKQLDINVCPTKAFST